MRKKISTDANSPEYWISKMQLGVCNCALEFMRKHNMNRQELKEYLGIPELEVTKLLNGNFRASYSNFVKISMLLEYYPSINFVNRTHIAVMK